MSAGERSARMISCPRREIILADLSSADIERLNRLLGRMLEKTRELQTLESDAGDGDRATTRHRAAD
jgi:hypothetical protein